MEKYGYIESDKKFRIWNNIFEVIFMSKNGRNGDKKVEEEKNPNRNENMNHDHNIRKQALGPNTKR